MHVRHPARPGRPRRPDAGAPGSRRRLARRLLYWVSTVITIDWQLFALTLAVLLAGVVWALWSSRR